jgi:outer membrane protein assembly factor BamB
MQLSKLFSLIAVALLVAVVFAGVVAIPAAAQTDTMQFRYNAQHTGDYSPVAGPVPSNGQLKWRFQTGGGELSTSAVVNGVVYVGSDDGNVYALNATSGTKLWNFTTGDSVASSPAVVNGVVYVGSGDGNLYAIYANNGQLKWNFWIGSVGSVVWSSPAVANGVVYIGCVDGNVYAFSANDGTKLWSFTTGGYGPTGELSTSAVVNGVVYVGSDDGNVYALNATSGTKLWNFTTGDSVGSSPAVVNGVVYVGSDDGNLYALNATTGAKVWSYATGPARTSPAVANGVVYIGDSNVYAFSANDGTMLWMIWTGTTVGWGMWSSPAVANGVVYVGESDGNLYAFSANDGTKLWSFTTGAYVESSAVVDGVVYVSSGDGNLYALGKAANAAPSITAVTVPIDPQRVNDPVSVSAAFTDPDQADTHTATWTWGDGTTSAGTIIESNGAGTVSGSHVYAEAGVYTVSVKVTDNNGASAEATAQSYVVVYNPDAGFVTGGGWITSPIGAYANDPVLTGKATFGFVSKYQKGANTPSGNTEFQFKVANLNFKSTSYEWLVIAGAKAQYKGTGTINGAGSYKFMLSAVDGNLKGTGPDTFRMKIWDDNGVVYDNSVGTPDTAAPTMTLGGGSIVIHP